MPRPFSRSTPVLTPVLTPVFPSGLAAPTRAVVTPLHEVEKIVELVLVFACYALIARLASALQTHGHRLDFFADHAIPFSAPFIYAYVAMWLSCLLPFLYTRTNRYYRRIFGAFMGTMLFAYIVFIVFPTEMVLRADVAHASGFAPWLVGFVYAHDSPFNCFPSLHVALGQLVAWSMYTLDRPAGRIAWVLAILITLSTLLVKQHYVADVAFGTALAWAASRISLGRFTRRHPPQPSDHRHRLFLLIPVALQATAMLVLFLKYKAS